MASFVGHPHSYHTMPAVHSFRRSVPLSPPDTDRDSTLVPPVSLSGNPGADFDVASATGHYLGATPDRARYQPRRTSALSYQNSGARDLRDRSHGRGPKNLVVVIPPPEFPLDQGQLGNVLSMGPRHRLSQGILMPLFPSMFGQLNAIAREYNFPSTVGLCLYLHINENGITMTPRISDDSWQYLFGHLFEGRPSSGCQQLPIGGSIEFDIDLTKARWFDTWVSGTLRDSEPAFPQVVTSQTLLEAHWRGESQTTNADEQPVEDRWDASGSHTLVNNSQPGTLRHLPRKLSLVDRLEVQGIQVPPKSHNLPDLPSPTHALSPIPQSAVPRRSKSDLERRVNSWRVTTELYPDPMTEAYQPVPDVGVSARVTAMDEYALERSFRQGVQIDEYLWSVTSPGPRSPVMESPIASSRLSSVHLDRRANGTVPLTPTTMTSWGPADDDRYSVIPSVSRLPSPDAGERVVEDIMAPRSCAVWGNSFGWRSAISWKEVYPYSATQTKPTIRAQLQDPKELPPQYPDFLICPTVDPLKSSPHSVWGSSFGWQRELTWRKVYPYSTVTMQPVAPTELRGAGGLVSKYPSICIYPAVYPSFEIYPACTVEEDISQPVSVMLNGSNDLISCYPSLVIYPAVYPHFDIYPPIVEDVDMKGLGLLNTSEYSASTLYPSLVIYPAVCPHFDLYPATLQVTETFKQKEVDVRLVNTGHLTAEYPNMTIYPSAYPYLDLYPTQDTRKEASSVVWGVSFGWLSAKTWIHVYPLHTANPPKTKGRVDDQSSVIAGIVTRKQAIWGSSFGWKSATTWRAVWPTPYTGVHPDASPVSVHLGQQGGSSLNYPYLVIYPNAYPHFNIYPPRAAIVDAGELKTMKKDQYTVDLIPHYPNLIIYPAVYPHLDVYPAFSKALAVVEHGKGQSNLRRRRIEMWRAKTAAQVGLVELIANNHIWEVDEPLQLDLADYAWSRTSAGPPTAPLELSSPSTPGSVHMDRRIRGSELLTPSTATTWGPQDDWHSDILSIERLPSPDLGQRVLDDVEDTGFSHPPWHLVRPLLGNAGQVKTLLPVPEKSVFIPEYPHLVIYPPVYPHFDLYPTWANVPTLKNKVTETPANPNIYPALDIYPAVYPHFNIYPTIVVRIESPSKVDSNVRHERVETRLPSLYPNFDIYHACYPYNLDYIYPSINSIESTQIRFEASCCYPWLVVYPPVYPFIIPYPDFAAETSQPSTPDQSHSIFSIEWKLISVKLPAQYPMLDLYPAGYPWSLESVYPAVSVDDSLGVAKSWDPYILIRPAAYPFVQPYPSLSDPLHIPGSLDEGEYESVKVFLVLSEHVNSGAIAHSYFDLHPAPPLLASQQDGAVQDADVGDLVTPLSQVMDITPRRERKTHLELHASVFRCLEKRRARNSKTHLQLHTEVFQDGVVWTPSGYVQDLTSLTTKRRADIPVQESQRRPSQDNPTPRPSRSRSGTLATQPPDKIVFPLRQPPALPPLRVRSPGIPPQPFPAVSETPMPRVSSPSGTYPHMRSTSSRLSQAVKSIVHRRGSSATPASPPSEDHNERPKDYPSPTRFLSLVDRRPGPPGIPAPLPHANTSEFLTRIPRSSQTNESLVLQRARTYEQATANQSSGAVGTKGTHSHSPFTLPPLPPMPQMTEVTETIEKSKYTFA